MQLEKLGWNDFFQVHFDLVNNEKLSPARIAQVQKGGYSIFYDQGTCMARVSGKFRHQIRDHADLPAIGDWVVVDLTMGNNTAIIHGLLPRKSKFSRKAVLSGGMPESGGKTAEQVLAANVDIVFLVSGLDDDFNIRRIERFMTIAWDSGAAPVIILNKMDLCHDLLSRIKDVKDSLFDVPVIAVSAIKTTGLDLLMEYLSPGRTSVFLGASGVGKSTIINSLLGYERQKTNTVRGFKDRGRHTTTYREMIILPGGGLIIDTPGIREIQPWDDNAGINRTFKDVEQLAQGCRFRDCKHENEPGCAVRAAIREGKIEEDRLVSYLKLQREMQYLEDRKEERGRQGGKAQWEKQVARFSRQWKKHHDKA